jgi:hypothetical protein
LVYILMYSRATLIGTPCVLPLEGPNIWKVPLTEKALFYVINVPAKTSVRPKPGPVIWKVPISKVPITVARLYLEYHTVVVSCQFFGSGGKKFLVCTFLPYSCGVVLVFLVLARNSFWCYVRT